MLTGASESELCWSSVPMKQSEKCKATYAVKKGTINTMLSKVEVAANIVAFYHLPYHGRAILKRYKEHFHYGSQRYSIRESTTFCG